VIIKTFPLNQRQLSEPKHSAILLLLTARLDRKKTYRYKTDSGQLSCTLELHKKSFIPRCLYKYI